jgi:magnesium transporter
MQKRYHILERRLVEAEDGSALVSIYVNPDDAELKQLVGEQGLDAHALHSALDADEVPRVEVAPKYVAALVKRPKSYTAADNLSFEVSTAGLFLFGDRLVIILPDDVPLVDTAQQLKRHTATALFVHVLERLVAHFREHLKVISLVLDEVEERLPRAADTRSLQDAYALTKSLVRYVAALRVNAGLFDELERNAERLALTAADRGPLAHAAIDNRQCLGQAELYVALLSQLVATRSAITQNTLSVRFGTLTRVVLAFAVPLLVLTIFSVSPLESEPWGLWLALGVAAAGMLGAWMLGRPGP